MSVVTLTPRFRMRAVILAGAVVLAAGLGACGRVGETNVHGIVVSESMLASIKPGTPQAQVVDALGTPSTTSTIDGEAYYYISQTTSRPVAFMSQRETDRTVLVVYFDKGRVRKVAHYGMQDGKVFDYVTRTTPTGGGDRTFVQQLVQGLGRGLF